MKYPSRKKPSRPKRVNENRKLSNGDSFFEPDSKRQRRRRGGDDEDIDSLPSDEEDLQTEVNGAKDDEPDETAAEIKLRLAREQLEKIGAMRYNEESEGDEGEAREEREGRRDSLIAEVLLRRQLEESGRARRLLSSRVRRPEPTDEFRLLVKHRQCVTSVALSVDDERGFSASKDGTIMHWDVESGRTEKYLWPSEDILLSHHAKPPLNSSGKRSKQVLALAVSSDGRYLASGGLDRHVHLWDTRSREHIQAFHGHKGPVSCLSFRQGTAQLFSGSFDRQIKLWNAEDRTHMHTLHGHESEVVTIDCLYKENLLSAGRDRIMHLYKVPDEKRLLFRAPSSVECCCFIDDDEFLSGADDGSIVLWSAKKKKPIHIVRNAHARLSFSVDQSLEVDREGIFDSCKTENGFYGTSNCSLAQSWVSSVAVCRGSDLAASGAANGVVRLWAIGSGDRIIQPLLAYPVVGCINSLVFAKSGRFLLAGVGQEPRLGRWGRIPDAQNGVAIHPIRLKE